MTTDHRARRNRLVPGWVDRAWAWISDASDGIAWFVGLSLLVSAAGFVISPVDLPDRNKARALQFEFEWFTAQEVRVHVDYVTGLGGGYSEVDAVRVRLAGVRNEVALENVNAANENVIYEDIAEGWQDPTPITGYEPPLKVRVQRDSDGTVVAAMAKDDYEYWTEANSDPKFGLGFGVAGLNERQPPSSSTASVSSVMRRGSPRAQGGQHRDCAAPATPEQPTPWLRPADQATCG